MAPPFAFLHQSFAIANQIGFGTIRATKGGSVGGCEKAKRGKRKAKKRGKAERNLMAKTELETRTKLFAIDLVDLVERMPRNRAGEVVGKQLLRSGTSIGANYREANRAISLPEFQSKLGIATKESAETQFWLELVNESTHLRTVGQISFSTSQVSC